MSAFSRGSGTGGRKTKNVPPAGGGYRKGGGMEKQVYIVGAHSRGRTLKAYLEYLYPGIKVAAFLVDDLSGNPETADGIPVKQIGEGLRKDCPVYLGTRGIYHAGLTERLEAAGMKEIIPVTVELDRKLRNAYVCRHLKEEGREFSMIDDLPAR